MKNRFAKLLITIVVSCLITAVVSGCGEDSNNANSSSNSNSNGSSATTSTSSQKKVKQEFVYTTDSTGKVSLSKHNKVDNKPAETIVIPKAENGTLTKIEPSVFVADTTVKSVVIPDTVQEIGDIAFKGCVNLKSVTLPKSLKTVGIGAFMSTGLKQVTLPSTVTQVGVKAFSTCSNLEKLTINEGVVELNNIANNCKNLKELYLPSTITTVAQDFTVLPITTVYTPNNPVVIDYCTANGINYQIIN